MTQHPTLTAHCTCQPSQSLVSDKGCDKIALEMTPTLRLNSLWCTMKLQHLPFQAQDGVSGHGIVYGVCFQPPSSEYGSEYVPFALVGLWEWSNVVNLPGLTISKP